MRNLISRISLTFLLALTSSLLLAQETMNNEPVQMAEGMRSNGKIYVVVAVVLTIVSGVVGYLIHIDRKISSLEKNSN
jgi:heme/copper-type cytochrome/quinol oxidase subunit 2